MPDATPVAPVAATVVENSVAKTQVSDTPTPQGKTLKVTQKASKEPKIRPLADRAAKSLDAVFKPDAPAPTVEAAPVAEAVSAVAAPAVEPAKTPAPVAADPAVAPRLLSPEIEALARQRRAAQKAKAAPVAAAPAIEAPKPAAALETAKTAAGFSIRALAAQLGVPVEELYKHATTELRTGKEAQFQTPYAPVQSKIEALEKQLVEERQARETLAKQIAEENERSANQQQDNLRAQVSYQFSAYISEDKHKAKWKAIAVENPAEMGQVLAQMAILAEEKKLGLTADQLADKLDADLRKQAEKYRSLLLADTKTEAAAAQNQPKPTPQPVEQATKSAPATTLRPTQAPVSTAAKPGYRTGLNDKARQLRAAAVLKDLPAK